MNEKSDDKLIKAFINPLAFLEVDEEGTEAAAATVVEIVETSAGPGAKPSILYINRPFAFFIREKHSEAIIFSGKLTNPLN